MDKSVIIKKLLVLFIPVLVGMPLSAQEQTDTVYMFRFVPQKDMFYIPFGDNQDELLRLSECVKQHKQQILEGKIPLYVDGYCNSLDSRAENMRIAKTRSNRVKSKLIIRQGLHESSFITRNHADNGDYVTVRIVVPLHRETETGQDEDTTTEQSVQNRSIKEEYQKQTETVTTSDIREETTEPAQTVPATKAKAGDYGFTLRLNLLRWATLTPDLGIEWRINRNWGIQVNGSWTSWSWDNKERRYALLEISPELRHYIGKEKRGYLGAMYHTGSFNYKLGDTGKQGDLTGGGLTGGYQMRLNNSISLDLSIGAGCTHAEYEKYTVTDGVRIKQGKANKNYWGINHAGITLVWQFK